MRFTTVEAFIDTYHGEKQRDYGLAFLDEHRDLAALCDGEGHPFITPTLDEASPKTRENFRQGKTVPYSVQGIDELERIGFTFPLTFDHPKAKTLAAMYLHNLLSGYVKNSWGVDFIFPTGERGQVPKRHLQEVSLRPTKQKNQYVPQEAGRALGRLLHSFGLPRGMRKADCPPDLSLLEELSNHETFHTLILNSILAQKVQKSDKDVSLHMYASRREEDARNTARTFVDVLERITGYDFTSSITPRTDKTSRTSVFCPRIHVTRASREALLEQPLESEVVALLTQ